MNSTLINNLLSDVVYGVDLSRIDLYQPLEGEKYYYDDTNKELGEFHVIKTQDDPYNGMQAMAIAPIINGVPDKTRITIVYAGTNIDDKKDIITDIKNVILGKKKYVYTELEGTNLVEKPYSTQIDTALSFADEIKARHPNATIDVTGHSLGGFLALIVSVKNRWKSTVFNAPSPHMHLSAEDVAYLKKHIEHYVNYRHADDVIGNFGGDPLGIARTVLAYDGDKKDIMVYHGLKTWRFDKDGNIVDKFNNVVHSKDNQESLDINGDGVIDFKLGSIDLRPKDLLSSGAIITNANPIKLNTDILNTLAYNLNSRLSTDLSDMARLSALCVEKNQAIVDSFEKRKQQITEKLTEIIKNSGYPSVLYGLKDTIGFFTHHIDVLNRLSGNMKINENLFYQGQFPLINGILIDYRHYNKLLTNLQYHSVKLLDLFKKHEIHEYSQVMSGEPIFTKTLWVVDQQLKKLVRESDKLFKGEGLRESKKDGMAQALEQVLHVIQKNTIELSRSLTNLSEFVSGLATNFNNMDNWIGKQLESGEFVADDTVIIVPQNYQAYLERDNIFDDVKDVLQAFDRQVEQNSQLYAQSLNEVTNGTLTILYKEIRLISDAVVGFKNMAIKVKQTFDEQIIIRESATTYTPDYSEAITTTKEYSYGSLKRLYPPTVVGTLEGIDIESFTRIESFEQAYRNIHNVRGNLTNLMPQLKTIIEKSVYEALDLDEIVKSQKAVSDFANRLYMELNHVLNVIDTDGMSSLAVLSLKYKIIETTRLVGFYTQFINDCFGDNNTVTMNANNIGSKDVLFTLN